MERREHKRHRFWLPVEVDGLPSGYAVSHDASGNGLLLVCSATLEVGATVRLTFRLPPGGPAEFTVDAEVVRVAKNDEDPDGLWPFKMAVRFEAPIETLESFLRDLPPSTDDA